MEALLLLDDMDGVDRHVNSQPSTFIWHSQKEQRRLELYLLDKHRLAVLESDDGGAV